MTIRHITPIQRWMLRTRLRYLSWRDSTSLDGCWDKVKGFIQQVARAATGYLRATYYRTLKNIDLVLLKWKFLTRTLASHADLYTLSQSTVLTLVAVMLIYRAVPRCTTSVAEVPTDATLEERLAPLAGKYSIVFSRRLVAANCALHLLHIFFRRFF